MTWGIKFALKRAVERHGELSDEANIWAIEQMDPPPASEEEAYKLCNEYEADSDGYYVFRPFEKEDQ